MIRGKENIKQWIIESDCPHWTIYPYNMGKNNYLFSAKDQDNLSMDKTLEDFDKALSVLETGRYIIVAKPKASSTKGFAETSYEHVRSSEQGTSSQVAAPIIAGVPENEVQKRIDSAISALKTEMRLEALERENAQLRKELRENSKEDVISGAIRKLDPYMEPIMQSLFPQVKQKAATASTSIAVSGFAESKIQEVKNKEVMNGKTQSQTFNYTPAETEEEASERSQSALQIWADSDENFLQIVEKIVHVIETDPAKYKMFSQMLINS
jgi:hypothetical protein